MPKSPAIIRLTDQEESTLREWIWQPLVGSRLVERAQIILLASEGQDTREIANRLQTRVARVSKWRQRFAQHRLQGLLDRERSGKPAHYGQATEERILAQLNRPVPEGHSSWNGDLIAKALGDISKDQVWRVLRRHDICLQRRRSWCVNTEAEFSAQTADVIGLYLNPPENALVLSVDDVPPRVAGTAQGYLRLPNGRVMNGSGAGN